MKLSIFEIDRDEVQNQILADDFVDPSLNCQLLS